MTNDNMMSKMSGYNDATCSCSRKENMDSWYYQGYLEGQCEIISDTMRLISKLTSKVSQSDIDYYYDKASK